MGFVNIGSNSNRKEREKVYKEQWEIEKEEEERKQRKEKERIKGENEKYFIVLSLNQIYNKQGIEGLRKEFNKWIKTKISKELLPSEQQQLKEFKEFIENKVATIGELKLLKYFNNQYLRFAEGTISPGRNDKITERSKNKYLVRLRTKSNKEIENEFEIASIIDLFVRNQKWMKRYKKQ